MNGKDTAMGLLTAPPQLGMLLSMNFGVLFEPIEDESFSPGYYYAHVPSLGLTAHGPGIEGARVAALELVRVWLAEKKANGEQISSPPQVLFSTLDISEDALQSA